MLKWTLDNVRVFHLMIGAIVGVFLFFFVWPEYNQNGKISIPAAKIIPETEAQAPTPEEIPPSLSDYAVIAEQNLFHQDRKIPPRKKEMPKPEIVLSGTTIMDGVPLALIQDKKGGQILASCSNRQRPCWVKIGDRVQGYTVTIIEPNSIFLQKGDDVITASLHKRQGKQKTSGARNRVLTSDDDSLADLPPRPND
jgi:hypothetical protein